MAHLIRINPLMETPAFDGVDINHARQLWQMVVAHCSRAERPRPSTNLH